MTTSSSDRCTRISPSAVLDDRLDGKDLEWARDHLRRCEACRERVEDFREMLLRVGRLPKATVGAAAMDEAYALSVPESLRDEAVTRRFELTGADTSRPVAPTPLPSAARPEVASMPDLMTELEREIFRDEPAHPTPMDSSPEPIIPTLAPPPAEEPAEAAPALEPAAQLEEPETPALDEPAPTLEAKEESWREVPIDSHREPPPAPGPPSTEETDWARLLESIAGTPEPAEAPSDEPKSRNVIYDEEPAIFVADEPEAEPTPPPKARKSDTGIRIAVGFAAAACVLIAAVLYEGGYLTKLRATPTAATATARASLKPSPTARATASASSAPSASAPPATVLYVLGNGAAGDAVFRIRPGTAVAGYTRLVFDMRGNGLPSMVITRPDDLHLQVIFKKATVTGVPVNGIRSYQVSAIEPGVQSGPDGVFTIDLARPARVTAFTLPATGSYAWRLVVDVHTS